MKELEPIYIRIAECKACVNDEDGNFDELASQVLAEALQVKELLDDSSDLPYIQLEESVWCDFLDYNDVPDVMDGDPEDYERADRYGVPFKVNHHIQWWGDDSSLFILRKSTGNGEK